MQFSVIAMYTEARFSFEQSATNFLGGFDYKETSFFVGQFVCVFVIRPFTTYWLGACGLGKHD